MSIPSAWTVRCSSGGQPPSDGGRPGRNLVSKVSAFIVLPEPAKVAGVLPLALATRGNYGTHHGGRVYASAPGFLPAGDAGTGGFRCGSCEIDWPQPLRWGRPCSS